jgi:hypothetical protein
LYIQLILKRILIKEGKEVIMRVLAWNRPLTSASAVVVLLASVFATPFAASAQPSKIPVISLKRFIAEPQWALDITWSAHDAYEDADRSAKLEMTATVRYILNQRDKKDAWGRWDIESVKSHNLVFSGSLVYKKKGQRTEWRSTAGPVTNLGAAFEVGGFTPGYRLTLVTAFPIKATGTGMGTMDGILALGTWVPDSNPPVSADGPLPSTGTTIHGSLVLPWDVPPFGLSPLPKTRVGIQFVLQPIEAIPPLVPLRKK